MRQDHYDRLLAMKNELDEILEAVRADRRREPILRDGDILFSSGGEVHHPMLDNPVWKQAIKLPQDFTELHLGLTIRTGGDLYQRPVEYKGRTVQTGAKLFFFGLPNMRNLIGFAIVRNGVLTLRSGFGMPLGDDKPRGTAKLELLPDQDYFVDFAFTRERAALKVASPVGLQSVGVVCVPSIKGEFPKGREAVVTLGGDGGVVEPVQVGWTFSSLEVWSV